LSDAKWLDNTRKTPSRYTRKVGYEVNTLDDSPWLRLTYTLTASQEALDYRIRLATTRPQFGGMRWWFICPLIVNGAPCSRRVGKLYFPPGARYYGCRHCYRLAYTSCQESHKFDGLYRHMAGNLGCALAIRLEPRGGCQGCWGRCPLAGCGRRVARLYLPDGCRYFGCRVCHRLTYVSCQQSHRRTDTLAGEIRELGKLMGNSRLRRWSNCEVEV
jgi:hypothetical protein